MGVINPVVKFDRKAAQIGVSIEQQKILVLGQKIAAGTAVSGQLYDDLGEGVTYKTLAGDGSISAAMIDVIQKVIVNSRKKPQIDAIFYDDEATSVAATGTITVGAVTTTTSGFFYITIGSELNHKFEVGFDVGADETAIAASIAFSLTGDTSLPVTAIAAAGVVTLTAKNKGAEGNFISLKYENDTEVALTLVEMASGTLAPDISALSNAIVNVRYQTIVMPGSYDIDSVAALLESRFNTSAQGIILDGVLIVNTPDTFANLTISTTAQNSRDVSISSNSPIVGQDYVKGFAYIELSSVIAAQIAAVRALRLTADADISEYVQAAGSSKDNFGGIALSTLPYFNSVLPFIAPAEKKLDWSFSTYDLLVDAGYAVFANNQANTNVLLGSTVTRYKTNTLGNDDVSFKYLNYVDQTSVVNEYFTSSLKNTYSQYRLTNGGLIPDRNMTNAGDIKAECIKIYGELANLAIMAAGAEARKKYTQELSVTIDEATGVVTINMLNLMVTQVRVIEGVIQISFTL